MTKKLLPIMIGAALAGSMTAAAADVTVFGHIDEAILNTDSEVKLNGVKDSSESVDDTNLKSTTSSIGFKGSEDLGNGLKAIFSLDFQYDLNNVGSITDRDQWVGLAGNFGKVRLGTISTGYKSHGAMIDPLYRTVAQGRDIGLQSFLHKGAGEDGEGRAENTIRYDSPSFNGLKVVAHYTLDSDEGDGFVTAGNPLGEEDDDSYGVGVSYENGGILVFADYITNDSDWDGAGDLEAWKVGGKYTLNNFAVYAQYESIEDDTATVDSGTGLVDGREDDDGDLWHVAGSYTMGNNMLYAGYGSGEADVDFFDTDGTTSLGSGDAESDAFTIAGVHMLSKRTWVYAAYANFDGEVKNKTTGDKAEEETDWFALGVKHKF